jgi:hypothetical protein
MELIFTRDVGGFHAGEILELDWGFVADTLRVKHGITDPIETYTMSLPDAARRYVATLTPRDAASKVSRKLVTP